MFTREHLVIKDKFQNFIEKGNLGHSYIFWGDTNAASDLSYWLAGYLENNPKVLVDAKFVNPINGTIGIDHVREINNFLWQGPLSSSRKILVIKDAGQLTSQAQNALLKIVEEPPKHGLIILIVEKLEQLLPTLLSRFQKIYICDVNLMRRANDTDVVKKFLAASKKEKIYFVRELLEKEESLEKFIQDIFLELDKDPIKNFKLLKELLTYWTNICQYNTNKKLQLEAWIESFN